MTDAIKKTAEIVRVKRAEIQKLLEQWSREEGLAAMGVQLEFTLSASYIPGVVHAEKPVTKAMKCSDFFTQARFATLNITDGVGRTIGTLSRQTVCVRRKYNDQYELHNVGHVMTMSLGYFLKSCTSHDLLRMPNFGRRSLNMVTDLLKHHGFELKKGY